MDSFFQCIIQFITSHFDFSQPITLSDCISTIAMLAAVVAAIVAINGNRQSQKATKNAEEQFQENMREQLRAINVSLFDLRMEILTFIETGDYELIERNLTREKMLFNDSIADSMEKYVNANREEKRYAALKREFINLIQSHRADDTYEEATDLLRQIDDYSQMDPDNPLYEQAKEALRKHSFTGKWTHGTDPFDVETINYVDTEEAERRYYTEANNLKEQLIKTVKQFIETSIQ